MRNKAFIVFGFVIILSLLLGFWACNRERPKPPQAQPEDPRAYFFQKFPMDGSMFARNDQKVLFQGENAGVPAVFVFDIGNRISSQAAASSSGARPVAWFPDDDRILYSARPEGQTAEHLFVRNLDGGTVDVTPWPGVQSVFYVWSRDRKSFYFGSNKVDRRFLYVYKMNIAGWKESLILETQDMKFADISGDENTLGLWKYTSPDNSALYTCALNTGNLLEKIAPKEAPAIAVPQMFDRSEPVLYYLTNEGASRTCLVKYLLDTKEITKLEDPESIIYARKSPSGRYQVLGYRKENRPWFKVLTAADREQEEIFSGEGIVIDISHGEGLLLTSTELQMSPTTIRIHDLQSSRTVGID